MMNTVQNKGRALRANVSTAVLAAACFGLAGAARAQEAPPQPNPPPQDQRYADDDIVVTAQKREERLLDVPIPISAIGAQTLTDTNQTRLQDYFTSIPGLTVSPVPAAGGQQAVVVRGITTGSGSNPAVGITVDDVPFGAATTTLGNVIPDFDPSDLARIEVLRGPQGALYGAASMGGLVKFVTAAPSTSGVSGRLSAGISGIADGSALGYAVNGNINLPLGDSFAVRVSGFTRRRPGYIDNVATGQNDINEEHVSGGMVSALWKPTSGISLRLSALYQDDKGDGADQITTGTGLSGLQQNFLRGTGDYRRKTQAYSGTITAAIGKAELVSITGYNINQFSNSLDQTPSSGATAQALFGVSGAKLGIADARTRKLTQEARVTVPFGDSVDWLVGGFYSREWTNVPQFIGAVNPATGALVGRFFDTVIRYRYSEIAAFTNITIHFTDRFDLQLGGRESRIKLDRLAQTTFGAPNTAPSNAPAQYSKADSFTYLVTPRFKLSPNAMIYARFASGFRPGGPNNALCTARGFACQFEPDTTKTYEIGAKGSIADRLLTFDLSVYHIDWRDIQLQLTNTSAAPALSYTSNGSRAKSEGIELSLDLRPANGLTISAWGAYNKAVLTEPLPPGATVVGRAGDRLPFSPRYSGTLSVDYRGSLGEGVTGSLGGSVSRVGDRAGSFLATTARQTYPAYTKVDLRAGLDYRDWSLTLYATNLTDRRGVLGGGAGTFPPNAYIYLQPRTVGLSLARKF